MLLSRESAYDSEDEAADALGIECATIADGTERARCEVLLHHHDARLDEVYAAIGDGASTAREISTRVSWNTGPFDDFNLFMKRSALGETLSHLRLLQDEERVRRVDEGDRVRWSKA